MHRNNNNYHKNNYNNNNNHHNNNKDWDPNDLPPIEKNFYKECPEVSSRSTQEEENLRRDKKLEIIPAFPNQVVPKMTYEFSQIRSNFPQWAEKYFAAKKFERPTAIQGQTWPTCLSGNDLIGIAETGSGKTMGFLFPALVHMKAQEPCTHKNPGPVICILEPTRELAQQVHEVIGEMNKYGGAQIKSALVYGGQPKGSQRYALRDCEVVVGTPGRLLDFLEEGSTSLRRVTYFVLDEADQMLDMGFIPAITKIFEMTRPDRQTVMWSATWPKEIRELAQRFLKDATKIVCGMKLSEAEHSINKNITHEFYTVDDTNSLDKLKEILSSRENEKTLVFTNTKKKANDIAFQLYKSGYDSDCLHGDLPQSNRDRAIKAFKTDNLKILVATDVAARGLDVKNVTQVINYEVPANEDFFVHRVGRTGRAGTKGVAIHFIDKNAKGQNFSFVIKYLNKAGIPIPPELKPLMRTSFTNPHHRRGGGFNSYGRNFDTGRFSSGGGGGFSRGRGGHRGGSGGFHRGYNNNSGDNSWKDDHDSSRPRGKIGW